MLNESVYCNRILDRSFNRHLLMVKTNYEKFKNYTKCLFKKIL